MPERCASLQPCRIAAAEAGEDQERTQGHRHRIQRVAEEQGELLDEGDLDEHEGQADGGEVGHHAQFEPIRPRAGRMPLAMPRHP
ncbi:hypothetical protein D9M70_624760 [compost metagenome]